MVDRHHGPGGDWNDAYPFVRMRQPSAYCGVNSRALGGDERDPHPLNQGLCERASADEIVAYYQDLMQQWLATGRVQYLPMSEISGRGDERGEAGPPGRRKPWMRSSGTSNGVDLPAPSMGQCSCPDRRTCRPGTEQPCCSAKAAYSAFMSSGTTANRSASRP